MQSTQIFFPVLLQAGIVFYLYIALAVAKKHAVAAGLVDEQRRALYEHAWPESVIKINNCIRNQFEVPVLFYVLVLMLANLQAVGYVELAIVWAFVLTRVGHAYVHTHSNRVPVRRRLFSLGCLLLLLLWGLCIKALLM